MDKEIQILKYEIDNMKSTPDGRRDFATATDKGAGGHISLYRVLILRSEVRDEEIEILKMNPEDSGTYDKYQDFLNKKQKLREAEESLFGDTSITQDVMQHVGTRVTTDPVSKVGQIIADRLENESVKNELKHGELQNLFKRTPVTPYERKDYPADAPLMRYGYDRRGWKVF